MFGKAIVRGFVAAAIVSYAVVAQATVNIDLVPVGNPGNANDDTGYGSVAEVYLIGKYEVTAGQYTEFLNAKAAVTDTYGLYNTNMWISSYGCKIQQTPVSGGYTYSVASGYADRPVNFVSFWDAARFVNWLHNGQGSGDTESGAYINIGNQSTFARQSGARYFIPTENEWYKAAYHKNDGATGHYFDYPTGVDSPAPGRDMTEATNPGNNANYYGSPFPIDSPYYTTVKGEFELSNSPYGTFDQGGNLCELNETILNDSSRGLRGGSFGGSAYDLLASGRDSYDPTYVSCGVGFRVASVPEPGSLAMLAGIALTALLYYWRKYA